LLLEKLIVAWLVKKLPAFYGTQGFITIICMSLPLAPALNHILTHFLIYVLILSSSLCVGLPSGLFPVGFLTKIVYAFLVSPMHAVCSLHLILLYLITIVTPVVSSESIASCMFITSHCCKPDVGITVHSCHIQSPC